MADKPRPVRGWQFRWPRVFFTLLRRHNCPTCGGRLRPGIHTRVIQPTDADAHLVDWDAADVPIRGAVRLQEVVLRCPACGAQVSVQALWAAYRANKQPMA